MSEAEQWFKLGFRIFAPMVAGCLAIVLGAVFLLGYFFGAR